MLVELVSLDLAILHESDGEDYVMKLRCVNQGWVFNEPANMERGTD